MIAKSAARAPGAGHEDRLVEHAGSDILAAAVACLRTTAPAPDSMVKTSRSQIISRLHEQRRHQVGRTAVLAALAAALLGWTAWAGGTSRLSYAWHAITGLLGPQATEVPPVGSPRPRGGARPATSGSAADEPPIDVPPDPPSPASELGAPDTPRASTSKRVAPTTERGGEASTTRAAPEEGARGTPPREAAADPELSSYKTAHRTHFGGSSPETALQAWDDHLAAWPAGRWALEARYNRAICLVRLGRAKAAIDALRPFAEGRFGAYRQREAGQLIEALEGNSAPSSSR